MTVDYPPVCHGKGENHVKNSPEGVLTAISVYGEITRPEIHSQVAEAGLREQVQWISRIRRPGCYRNDIYVSLDADIVKWKRALHKWKHKWKLSWVFRFGAWPPRPKLRRECISRSVHNGNGATASNRLTVVTWNINGLSKRIREVELLLLRERPHFVALQETRYSASEPVKFIGYRTFATGAQGRNGKWGCMLLVKNELVESCRLLDTVPGRQIWVQYSEGRDSLVVSSVYLPPSSVKQLEVRKLRAKISKYQGKHWSVIVGGDFNEESYDVWGKWDTNSDRYKMLKEERKGSRRLDKLMRRFDMSPGTYQTPPTSNKVTGSAIDYCLVPTDGARFVVNTMYVGSSDHWPILSKTDVSISDYVTRGFTSSPRLNTKYHRLPWSARSSEVVSALYENRHSFEALDENADWAAWWRVLASCLDPLLGSIKDDNGKHRKSSRGRKSHVTPGNALRTARRRMRAAHTELRAARRRGNVSLWNREQYFACRILSKVLYKREKVLSKNRRWLRLQNRQGDSDWWSEARRLKLLPIRSEVKVPTAMKDEAGQIVRGTKMLQVWKRYFEALVATPDQETEKAFPLNRNSDCTQKLNLLATVDDEEFCEILERLKRRKSPGYDGMPNELYRLLLREELLPIRNGFRGLVNRWLRERSVPAELKRGIVTPIHKTGPKDEVQNYRGITLMPCAFKILMTIFARRLYKKLESRYFFVPEQHGFREQLDCVSMALNVVEIIQRRQSHKLPTFVCFIDLKKAYDSVPREALFEKLRKVGLDEEEMEFVENCYEGQTLQVKIDGYLTEEFPVMRGLLQGDPASPLLFDIFINDALEELNEEQLGVGLDFGSGWSGPRHNGTFRSRFNGAMFADDIALVAPSFRQLQRAVGKLHAWVKKWGLNFGLNKCKWIKFFPSLTNTADRHSEELRCEDGIIDQATSYKYLGVVLDKQLDFKEELKRREGMVLSSLKPILPFLASQERIHPRLKLQVIESTLCSRALYGCEVWYRNRTQLVPLQRTVNRAILRALMLRHGSTSAGVVRVEWGLDSLHVKARNRQAKALRRWSSCGAETWSRQLILSARETGNCRGQIGVTESWFKRELKLGQPLCGLDRYEGIELIEKLSQQERIRDLGGGSPRLECQKFYPQVMVEERREREWIRKLKCNSQELTGLYLLGQIRVNGWGTIPRLIANGYFAHGEFGERKRCLCRDKDETVEHIFFECKYYNAIRPNWTKMVENHLPKMNEIQFYEIPKTKRLAILLGGRRDATFGNSKQYGALLRVVISFLSEIALVRNNGLGHLTKT